MEASELRHKITIEKPNPASARDAAGQRITDWLTVAVDIWAKVEPLSGRAEFIAAQRQESTTHMITVRYGPQTRSLDATMRVHFKSRIFVMARPPINIDEKCDFWSLSCVEGLRTEN